MSSNPLFDMLLSIIGGGIAGTLVTLWFEHRQRRREAAVTIAQEYMAREQAVIKAEALYNKYRERPEEWSHNDTNALTSLGDWYEIAAVLILEKMVDEKLIKRIGIDRAMYVFYKNIEPIEPLKYDRRQWRNLTAYVKKVANYVEQGDER